MTRIIGPSGVEMDVEESVAAGLVDGGHAEYIQDGDEAQHDDHSSSQGELQDESAPQPGDDGTPADPTPDQAGSGPEKPRGNAGLEEWVEFAKTQGKDADGLNRDEIRALFKGE
ncbi:hypothetical protein D3C87_1886830 [compost metagenome]